MTDKELLQIIEDAARRRVTKLDLSGKQLEHLSPEIAQLTNLQELYLSGNQLSQLPPEIAQLINLQTLNLNYNQLSQLPVEISKLTNLQFLYLSVNELSQLPSEIGQLTHLQFLDLRYNQLRQLPPEIGQLTNLQSLNLKDNELSQLPPEISQLINLQSLNLKDNKLSQLPPEIGQLTNLQSLDLSSNRLSQLPSEIGQLTNLKSLDLTYNQLRQLPPEIGQLIDLQSLISTNNQLSQLPSEIGRLTNLQSLISPNNQLSQLPSEIGQLTNLKSLDLKDNQLSQLPPEIGQLTNLQSLDLRSNQLSQLPPEIGQLTNLKSLDLKDNQLSQLPIEISQLTKLQSIDLHSNQLRRLPIEIGQMTQLLIIGLEFNPIEEPSLEVVARGIAAIREYFRKKQEVGGDKLYEAKLLIVGEPGAGKTTLAKKIKNLNYPVPTEEDSTKGIEVIQWSFPMDNERNFRVNIWDFGGQEIYHATHQFFLTKRSLYVLVADNRREDTDFYYWLNVVQLLSENSPILIVKNENQDRHRNINVRQLRGMFENLKETLDTNLATNQGLPKILQEIKHYISNLPHVGSVFLRPWIRVREALESDSSNYISLEKYLDICQDYGLTSRTEKLKLSRDLHDLGVILHFQDHPILQNTVILKPKWGTDAVYRVLDNPQVISNLGHFNWNNLQNIWSEDEYANKQGELLELMKKFELCYEIYNQPQIYIAPQLLTKNQPEYKWEENNNLILCYTYEEFMPKGILHRFIVDTHQFIDEQRYIWYSGVILKFNETKAEVVQDYGKREIKIRVVGKQMRNILNTVAYELEKIHSSYGYGKKLKYQKLIPCNCPTCKNTQSPHFFEFEELEGRIRYGKPTIDCGKPPYHTVKVRELIDDIKDESKDSTNILISYSHKDRTWLEKLNTHLNALIKTNNKIKVWDDTQISPGSNWKEEFRKALAAAKIAVLLVSSEFLGSDSINTEELTPLLQASQEEGLTIFWIPIGHSLYEYTKIKDYQAAHNPAHPLSTLSEAEQDKALVNICKKLREAL